ncbi:MAG: hypothetical protein ACT4TC_11195 [Myxococcaceae bacterium]
MNRKPIQRGYQLNLTFLKVTLRDSPVMRQTDGRSNELSSLMGMVMMERLAMAQRGS